MKKTQGSASILLWEQVQFIGGTRTHETERQKSLMWIFHVILLFSSNVQVFPSCPSSMQLGTQIELRKTKLFKLRHRKVAKMKKGNNMTADSSLSSKKKRRNRKYHDLILMEFIFFFSFFRMEVAGLEKLYENGVFLSLDSGSEGKAMDEPERDLQGVKDNSPQG